MNGDEPFRPSHASVVAALMALLSESGLDPSPPIDPAILTLIGIKVCRSRYLLPHQIIIVGDFDRPPDWAALTDEQKVTEALMLGAVLFIHDNRE